MPTYLKIQHFNTYEGRWILGEHGDFLMYSEWQNTGVRCIGTFQWYKSWCYNSFGLPFCHKHSEILQSFKSLIYEYDESKYKEI